MLCRRGSVEQLCRSLLSFLGHCGTLAFKSHHRRWDLELVAVTLFSVWPSVLPLTALIVICCKIKETTFSNNTEESLKLRWEYSSVFFLWFENGTICSKQLFFQRYVVRNVADTWYFHVDTQGILIRRPRFKLSINYWCWHLVYLKISVDVEFTSLFCACILHACAAETAPLALLCFFFCIYLWNNWYILHWDVAAEVATP